MIDELFMDKKTICTISTKSHLFKSLALAESIHKIDCNLIFSLLIVDAEKESFENVDYKFGKIEFYDLKCISETFCANNIVNKYQHQADRLRWSLKPIFLYFLLEKKAFQKAICVDNDIFFFHNFDFLWQDLENHAVLLTAHWYNYNPNKKQYWLEYYHRLGLYNAGFVAANQKATKVLQWWAEACLYRCERNFSRGLFDDQKYLDLFPIIEPTTKILQHQGCNVAYWNIDICKRLKINEKVLINAQYPIVFIHFANLTMRHILKGKDALLMPYFEEYAAVLRKYKTDFVAEKVAKKQNFGEFLFKMKWYFLEFWRKK